MSLCNSGRGQPPQSQLRTTAYTGGFRALSSLGVARVATGPGLAHRLPSERLAGTGRAQGHDFARALCLETASGRAVTGRRVAASREQGGASTTYTGVAGRGASAEALGSLSERTAPVVPTGQRAHSEGTVVTQAQSLPRDVAVQASGCRQCLSLPLPGAGSRETACSQGEGLLVVVAELRQRLKERQSL